MIAKRQDWVSILGWRKIIGDMRSERGMIFQQEIFLKNLRMLNLSERTL